MINARLTDVQTQQAKRILLPPEELDDEAIITSIKQGDFEAYGGIMRRYNQRVFRVARSIVKEDAIAMDIVQESHIKAYSKINEFKGNSTFLVWLYSITRNEALMYLRKHKKERSMNVIDIHSLDGFESGEKSNLILDYKQNMDYRQNTPEGNLQNQQLKILINSYVDSLPEDFRIVFVLRAVEQISVKQSAEILQIKEETVKTRLFRAKALLRKKIQNYLDNAGMQVYEFGGEHCDAIVYNVMSAIRLLR